MWFYSCVIPRLEIRPSKLNTIFTTSCFLLQSLLQTLKTFPLFLHSREHVPGRRLIPVCCRLQYSALSAAKWAWSASCWKEFRSEHQSSWQNDVAVSILKKQRELVVCTQRDDLSDRMLVCESHICFLVWGQRRNRCLSLEETPFPF